MINCKMKRDDVMLSNTQVIAGYSDDVSVILIKLFVGPRDVTDGA